jgi:hypothetical protein
MSPTLRIRLLQAQVSKGQQTNQRCHCNFGADDLNWNNFLIFACGIKMGALDLPFALGCYCIVWYIANLPEYADM